MAEPGRILQYRRRDARKGRQFHVGIDADYRSTAPRTQRDAGLEFMQWEDRLPRQRPLWEDVVAAVAIIVFITIITLMTLVV